MLEVDLVSFLAPGSSTDNLVARHTELLRERGGHQNGILAMLRGAWLSVVFTPENNATALYLVVVDLMLDDEL